MTGTIARRIAPGWAATRGGTTTERANHVQSVARAFALLELMTQAGGVVGLSQLAQRSQLPTPTIHRLLRTLVADGYVRQLPSRRYSLGPKLIHLGAVAGQVSGVWAQPVLDGLVERLGESANLASLDRDMMVYVAQAPSPHAMRTFTEVGRRVHPHCTGVGKAILAELPDDQVRAIVARSGLPAQTDRTLTDPEDLLAELALVRQRGYAVDEGEQEVGVRCYAVAVPAAAVPTAVSISGPAVRLTPERGFQAVPSLLRAARQLAGVLSDQVQPA
jgi:IclR family acetate operon transcriptional repressor